MPDNAYWDACLFIEIFERKKQDRLEALDDMWLRAKRGELIIVTSTFTIVEVNKFSETDALPEEKSKKILDFFENPCISLR